MNKKKLVVLVASLVMVLTLAIGGTLAYFTAEDSADNVFTLGNVNIELVEKFEQNSELVPGLDITKEVSVKNTGSKSAYTRVHIAIPSNMDDGDPSFAAVNNFLHFNFTAASVAEGLWSWGDSVDAANYPGTGSDDWNFYTQNIDGVDYNVYVVTYESALPAGETTAEKAIHKVYLDPSVNAVANEDGTITYTDTHNNSVTMTADQASNIQIKVYAEATQTETFTDAYNALNTAFGVPGNYNPWAE